MYNKFYDSSYDKPYDNSYDNICRELKEVIYDIEAIKKEIQSTCSIDDRAFLENELGKMMLYKQELKRKELERLSRELDEELGLDDKIENETEDKTSSRLKNFGERKIYESNS